MNWVNRNGKEMFPIHQNEKLFLHPYDLLKQIGIAHIIKADLGPWNPKKVRTPTYPMLLRPNTIQKWDLHYAQAVRKTASFFPVLKQLGRNRVLPGNHGFFSFRHWLLVEPLEWNEIRISGDLSSPLTRNRLSLCRRLLPNGIIGRLIPRSSKKTDSSYSFFSFRIGSSLVLFSLMI